MPAARRERRSGSNAGRGAGMHVRLATVVELLRQRQLVSYGLLVVRVLPEAEETTIAQYRVLVVLASRGPQQIVDLAGGARCGAVDRGPDVRPDLCDRTCATGRGRADRSGPGRPGVAAAVPADPAARIPGRRDYHYHRLARCRTQARRDHMAPRPGSPCRSCAAADSARPARISSWCQVIAYRPDRRLRPGDRSGRKAPRLLTVQPRHRPARSPGRQRPHWPPAAHTAAR
jgi:hypothetical protein